MKKILISSLAIVALTGWATWSAIADEEKKAEGEVKTIKGEVVDMVCYLDHGAKGEKHKACANKCIAGGLPVGILADQDVYLIVGDHKPINDKLASLAAQDVKVTGKVVHRKGVHMIEVKDPDKDIVAEK